MREIAIGDEILENGGVKVNGVVLRSGGFRRRRSGREGDGDGGGGGGGEARDDAGDEVEVIREREEAEVAEVAGFASQGDDVGESDPDCKNTEQKHPHQNVPQ